MKYGYAPLREAIAARYGVPAPTGVPVSGGTSFANWIACAAVLDGCGRGAEVIVERPTYEPLLRIPQALGHRVRRLDRRFDDGYAIDLDRFAVAGAPRARGWRSSRNLHNPTGARIPMATLRAMARDARARRRVPAGRRGVPRVPVQEPARIVRARRAERADDQQPDQGVRPRRPARRLDPRSRGARGAAPGASTT